MTQTREGLIEAMTDALAMIDTGFPLAHQTADTQALFRAQARAALAVLEAHAAVVPREPTPKMCDAGADELPTQTCESTDEEAAAEIYRAMLAASPFAREGGDGA